MSKMNKFISLALVLTLFLGILPMQAFAEEKNSFNSIESDLKLLSDEEDFEFTDEDIESVIPVLEIINQIPDELLLNGTHEEINNFAAEKGVYLSIYNDHIGEKESDVTIITTQRNALKCALALGQLIVTVGLPASQIIKLKNYIAALGGIKQAAALLTGATFPSEKAAVILKSLATLLGTITGISGIRQHCLA